MNLILYNANIYTVNPAQPRATALAVANDRILAVGHDAEIRAVQLPNAQHVDLEGAFVMPGMIDAHLHLQWSGLEMRRVNVFEAPSVDVVVARVRERARSTPAGRWITGSGWTQDVWRPSRFPTAVELDAATSDHLVALSAKSGHAMWVNSAALQQCGISAQTPDPPGGQIVRDEAGNPTGVLLENAMSLITQHIPPPTAEEEEAATVQAMRAMNRFGLTGAHCMDGGAYSLRSLNTYQRLRERGHLSVRIVKQIGVEVLETVVELGLRSGFGDAWLRIGGIKIFADGALGPHTAAMIEPYENEPDNYGISTFDPEALAETVTRCNQHGLAAVIHAIGDRANHEALNAFEVAATQVSGVSLRNRIEHAQIVHPGDLGRFARLNVIASMQPIHAIGDMRMAETCWGERCRTAYAWRSLAGAGARLAFGSDSPVESFNPFLGLHAAITRRRPDGYPGTEGWYPEQRLTIEAAIEAYTIGAAYAGGMEQEIGSLEAGKLADLIVLSRDITRATPDELLDTHVERVLLNGRWLDLS
ncbi:MAG: amidohydrolase [Anaerolineae bacterium]|nr:amidohydrolase [Thermoflexales bacterium]MDW8407971.1 amidohydrolase [Anaerolineae bacterium]